MKSKVAITPGQVVGVGHLSFEAAKLWFVLVGSEKELVAVSFWQVAEVVVGEGI
jgi:hypothetical protein